MKDMKLTNLVDIFQEIAHEGLAEFKIFIKDENDNEFELSKINRNMEERKVEIILKKK
jgi:hypothetical protein